MDSWRYKNFFVLSSYVRGKWVITKKEKRNTRLEKMKFCDIPETEGCVGVQGQWNDWHIQTLALDEKYIFLIKSFRLVQTSKIICFFFSLSAPSLLSEKN